MARKTFVWKTADKPPGLQTKGSPNWDSSYDPRKCGYYKSGNEVFLAREQDAYTWNDTFRKLEYVLILDSRGTEYETLMRILG